MVFPGKIIEKMLEIFPQPEIQSVHEALVLSELPNSLVAIGLHPKVDGDHPKERENLGKIWGNLINILEFL